MIYRGTTQDYKDGVWCDVPTQFSLSNNSISFKDSYYDVVKIVRKPLEWGMYRKQDNSGEWYAIVYAFGDNRAWYSHTNSVEMEEAKFQVWDKTPNELHLHTRHQPRKKDNMRIDFLTITLDEKSFVQWQKFVNSLQ
jgi:hypothetical protein